MQKYASSYLLACVFTHSNLEFWSKVKGKRGEFIEVTYGFKQASASSRVNVLKTRSKFKGDNFDRVIKKNHAWDFCNTRYSLTELFKFVGTCFIPRSSVLVPYSFCHVLLHSLFLVPYSSFLASFSFMCPWFLFFFLRFSFLVPRSSFFVPRSSFLVPRSSFLVPRSSFLLP